MLSTKMNFFESLFGFKETAYAETRELLLQLASFENVSNNRQFREKCTFALANGQSVSAGIFSFPSVEELREQAHAAINAPLGTSKGKIRVQNVIGEARALHRTTQPRQPTVIQAASQFNLLEFPAPSVTPEHGITGYMNDATQGPACAIACAAGTAYRNYLVPVPFAAEDGVTHRGQTRKNQLHGLQQMEDYLMKETNLELLPWKVRNGYIESSVKRLGPFNELLVTSALGEEVLIPLLRIGVQENSTVTDDPDLSLTVTQTYNSAISIGYSMLPYVVWEPLARLVLKATYEATLLVGILSTLNDEAVIENGKPLILLTKVGGGVFRNNDSWIVDAIQWAIERAGMYGVDMDVQIVHFGSVDNKYRVLERTSNENDSEKSEL